MSIKGFKVNGTTQKYDYNSLDNLPTLPTDVVVSGQTPTIVAEKNTRYICGEVTSLNFTPCPSGICDVRFKSGTTVTVLTLPQNIYLPDWFNPFNLEPDTIYEINFADGVYGVVTTWT